MKNAIFTTEVESVSFDKYGDKKIGFHETYFTIEDVEEILKRAKEKLNENK